jgi:beta-N-acetylhexosaminidase
VSYLRIAMVVALVLIAGCSRVGADLNGPVTLPSGDSSSHGSAHGTITPGPTKPRIAAPTSPGPTCEALAASMPLAERIGELFMIAVSSGATPAQAAQVVRTNRTGSVLLVGTSDAGVAKTAAITAAIRGAAPGTIVATDQEGGKVQRLRGPGFDRMPTAMAQSQMLVETLGSAADTWGSQLAAAGVLYNLAPVADVVPDDKVETNAPIGATGRGYGSDPAGVASSVTAFIAGMHAGGVEVSLKHFPGLGEVTDNTDKTPATDTVTTRATSSATFRAGIAAGAGSVMVSSAIYTQIDPGVQAVFSSDIITGMLRGDLGFAGVVISDDLGLAKAVAAIAPGDRAVRFLVAGGDLVINSDPSVQAAMTAAVTQRTKTQPAFATRVTQSAARVLRLKAAVGAAHCQ